jgi:hypothetical protein
MRSRLEAELELARVMMTPPAMETCAVSRWIAQLQSLLSEVRRAEKREQRKRGK